MRVPAVDKELGMSVYATDSRGIGGSIRVALEDFLVEEILVDGSVATIAKISSKPALGASSTRQRFLLCVMVKRGWDTLAAIKAIAKQLGVDQESIHIAGIKDAKAISAQHITIENVAIEDLEKTHVKDIELRPIGYFRDALSAFYLRGNCFTITISNIKYPETSWSRRSAETISKLTGSGGIPNYFGHQRFGTTRAITHLVGRAIVYGNFDEAAMLFLAKPSPHEHPESRKAREALLSTRDFASGLKHFPRQLRYERLMLHHLVENSSDFSGAFQRLPLKLQLLFVQAYQAYLFNLFLSERLRHGFSLDVAEVGDYVISVDHLGLAMPKEARMVSAEDLPQINASIEAGKIRVALPLVGFAQKLSGGEMGQIEEKILKREAAKPAFFKVKELPRISAKGELRAIISPIREFRIEGSTHDCATSQTQRVKVSFMLGRGSYATLLLRELMKPSDPFAAGF